MKLNPALALGVTLLVPAANAFAGPFGTPFYGDAPDEHHAWAIHDGNRPQPKIITPGTFSSQEQAGKPPSDAVILFNGIDLSKWEADTGVSVPTKWIIKDGAMECVPGSGYIRTKEQIGDCQLHVEWAAPKRVEGDSQGRGNSGVFLMGLVEVQVLDNYNNPTYADGMAGSVYGQHEPFANALRPPGEFQVYDIIFRRPVYRDGKQIDPGYVTVFENGVVVQDHAVIEGETGHMRRAHAMQFPEAGPLKLQDHGNPVRYRNIWYRPLPARASEGGTDGWISTEAAMAKRKQIAASLRAEAEKSAGQANPIPHLLALAESIVYDNDAAVHAQVEEIATKYVNELSAMPADKQGSKKDEARHLRDVFNYLARFKIISDTLEPKVKLEALIKAQGWDKRAANGH